MIRSTTLTIALSTVATTALAHGGHAEVAGPAHTLLHITIIAAAASIALAGAWLLTKATRTASPQTRR